MTYDKDFFKKKEKFEGNYTLLLLQRGQLFIYDRLSK